MIALHKDGERRVKNATKLVILLRKRSYLDKIKANRLKWPSRPQNIHLIMHKKSKGHHWICHESWVLLWVLFITIQAIFEVDLQKKII